MAPATGHYEFSISCDGLHTINIYVRLNGQLVQRFYQENGPNSDEDSDDESHIFHLKLEKGDDVNLFLAAGELVVENDRFVTFIGKLISEIA